MYRRLRCSVDTQLDGLFVHCFGVCENLLAFQEDGVDYFHQAMLGVVHVGQCFQSHIALVECHPDDMMSNVCCREQQCTLNR